MKNISIKINIPIVKYVDLPLCQSWRFFGVFQYAELWLQGIGILRQEWRIFRWCIHSKDVSVDYPNIVIRRT